MSALLEKHVTDLIKEKANPGVILQAFIQGFTENIHKTALIKSAVEFDHDELVSHLLSLTYPLNYSVGYDNPTPLHMASYKGNHAMVRKLLQHGADLHNEAYMTINGHLEIVTPMQCAVSIDRVDILQLFYSHGASRDRLGNTPLHLAAKWGAMRCMTYLISMDTHLLEQRNTFGETPLFQACGFSLETVQYLISQGANPNVRNTAGQTVLHYILSPKREQDYMSQIWLNLPQLISYIINLDSISTDLINSVDSSGIDPLGGLFRSPRKLFLIISECVVYRKERDKYISEEDFHTRIAENTTLILNNFQEAIRVVQSKGPVESVKSSKLVKQYLCEIREEVFQILACRPFLQCKEYNLIAEAIFDLYVKFLAHSLSETETLPSSVLKIQKESVKTLSYFYNQILPKIVLLSRDISLHLVEYMQNYPLQIVKCLLRFGFIPEIEEILNVIDLKCLNIIAPCLAHEKRRRLVQLIQVKELLYQVQRIFTLKELCRAVICFKTKQERKNIPQKIETLPLPNPLKNFLLFKDK